jgi:AraC family transcriptional regulator, regulatory protein of adaptative response / DNA-3-methyladenine glycosylase II
VRQKPWRQRRESGPKTSSVVAARVYDDGSMLDWQTCSRARLSRDARFDGKFFIGVRTSGVYCRSICPAPHAKEKNVRYFPTAAAAAEAGFRPCLRCRPECSPGTPAWLGTPNTVSRALRLLNESGLQDGGVEVLAEHLGIGSRHLRRLFLQHLGASPRAVAQTRRLHFAKKLIDETNLPMTQIALAAGFGCVRRFNAGIKKTYHRTPSQIRATARHADQQAENEYVFRLRYRPPYHWCAILSFLRARATPGVEWVGASHYLRSIFVNGQPGKFEITHHEEQQSLVARVLFGDPCALHAIIERIRTMFDLNADWMVIASHLQSDPAMASLMEKCPGLRVPASWDPFELAVRAIVGQQISVAVATGMMGKLVQHLGQPLENTNGLTHLFPTPQALAEAREHQFHMPRKRSAAIRALATAVWEGKIRFDKVINLEEFSQQLQAIPGIGNWTAQYIAMRALGEPDAFPFGDLGLLRRLGLKSAKELERRAETWKPWRAYAAMYLWQCP